MLLITPKEVIQEAFSKNNQISENIIRPSKIDIAQEKFLRPKIGDNMFDKLCDGQYPELTDGYLKSPLAYFTRYLMLDELAVQVDQNGLTVVVDDTLLSQQNASSLRDISGKATVDETRETESNLNESSSAQTTKETDVEKQSAQNITANEAYTKVASTSNTEEISTLNQTAGSIQEKSISGTVRNTCSTDNDKDTSETVSQNTTDSSMTNETKSKKDAENVSIEQTKENSSNDAMSSSRNDNTSRRTMRPASALQIQALQNRALSDANTLMRKALRYIERNPELYPEYVHNPRFYF